MENDNNSQFEQLASIRVIGVGGAVNNAVNRMIEAEVQGVDFYVANTDAQIISASQAKNKIVLGKELSKGLGAGATPIVAKIAKDCGALTVAIVTKPLKFEGRNRNAHAMMGIENLKKTSRCYYHYFQW